MNEMKNRQIILLSIMLLFLTSICFAQELAQTNENQVNIYFFYGEGCPHCAEEEPFLKGLEEKYDNVNVEYNEVYYDRANAKYFREMTEAFEIEAGGVPVTFVDNRVWIGYTDYIGGEIETKVEECLETGCVDAKQKLLDPSEPEELKQVEGSSPMQELNTTINIPVIGKIDTEKLSLPIFTIMLAALDSFNPCAFFVLLFLLSMLIYAKSKARMLLIGGTFIFFSGLIYFVFMAAWLNIFLITGELKIVTTIAGIVALIIALINIKDYFFFKKGISLSISDEAKPTLFQRMRGLLKATSIISMLVGTIVLAITANLYELLCTAGFPMVFTRILTLNKLSTLSYYAYLLLYNIIYIIPLLIIVIVFTITLGAKRLTERGGRILKLLSGMMMLYLALVLLINPGLMNNILVSIGVITSALITSFVIILIYRYFKRKNSKKEENTKETEEI